jgi:hypothetical protein
MTVGGKYMPQIDARFEDPAAPPPVDAVFDAGTSLWARLDNNQLELWLGDYLWFSDFADRESRANCARTRDELLVECALRGRHDLIRQAWARMARNMRGLH